MPRRQSHAAVRSLLALLALLLALFALSGLAVVEPVGAQTDPATPTTAGPTSTTTTAAPTTTTTAVDRSTTSVAGSSPTEVPTTVVEPAVPATGDGDPTTTTLPSGPPPGFTEEQFRTFVDVVEACGSDPGAVCERVYSWTGNRSLAESVQWVFDVPLAIVGVVLLALLANWLVRRGIDRYIRRLEQRTDAADPDDAIRHERRALRMATASTTLASAASVAIFTMAVFVGLAQLDISLGPLLAGAGIAGVALGFGAQNIVRDVLAGIFVLVEDQYGIGDVIDAGRASGVVEGISLRMTRVHDIEGTLWFIPNGVMSEVGNMTQRWARVILDVEVAYGADHHEASRLIKEAADEMWMDPECPAEIIEEPEIWGIEALGESSVLIRVAVKSAPSDQWAAARELRGRIKDSFDAAGIEIPFPQRTLWVRSEPTGSPEAEPTGSSGPGNGH